MIRIVCLLGLTSVTRARLDPQPPYHDYELAPRALSFDPPTYHTYELGPTPQHERHNLAPRSLDLDEQPALDNRPPGEINLVPDTFNPVPDSSFQELDQFPNGPDVNSPPPHTNDLALQQGYPNLNPQALGFGKLPGYFDLPPGKLNLAPSSLKPVPASSFSEHELFPGGPALDPAPPYYQYDLGKAEELFHGFMTKYHRHYSPEEYLKRLEVFKENLKEINNDNELSLLQGKAPAAGINIFADQSWEEFADGVTPLLRVRTAVVYSVLTKIMRRKGL